ncbi:3-demethylubiquinone-9 3-methyltransferase [Plesiocystis pacifica SIR-1]|uniref:3-demethylubiquinone-9 3-methyltransferase n=1 Tax=Plesiocystis pacifica SIR-1 TaxID=391625 RepID=A6FX62_9BACT|nr:class I SAM-dependent methyltransferase [Plesiocystis pacifica]EDM81886.1 3-demethylubiquinone-9 3-methyltransferase [Plesiocystis pacifica SIR-1]
MNTDNTRYYDAFARGYDDGRDRGYHKLIDDQAAAIVERVGRGKEALEVGCGTGLVMDRVANFASRVEGVDISPGMLERARARGLEVREGSATQLPYADASFDVVYSFKVLAHVEAIEQALAEMARVARPGGHVIFDIYNRDSLRYLIRRARGPRATSKAFAEDAISTRFDTLALARGRARGIGTLVDVAGIRVATVHPKTLELPGIGPLGERLEWALMDSRLKRFAGFLVLTVRVAD